MIFLFIGLQSIKSSMLPQAQIQPNTTSVSLTSSSPSTASQGHPWTGLPWREHRDWTRKQITTSVTKEQYTYICKYVHTYVRMYIRTYAYNSQQSQVSVKNGKYTHTYICLHVQYLHMKSTLAHFESSSLFSMDVAAVRLLISASKSILASLSCW